MSANFSPFFSLNITKETMGNSMAHFFFAARKRLAGTTDQNDRKALYLGHWGQRSFFICFV